MSDLTISPEGDMVLAGVQTVTGAKTFGGAGAVGRLKVAGTTSGSTILDATAVAGSGTVTMPTTGTLATLAGTETLSAKTLTSPLFQGIVDGWITSSDTWVYATASTFTIAGVDLTTTFTKGTRLKFTQTTVKYAVVVASSFSTNTTVTIAVNTDFTIANAAISANSYSYDASPQGYPTTFAYTTTYTGFSADPTGTVTRFSLIGNICTAWGSDTGNGTSNTTAKTFTAPIVSAASRPAAVVGWMINNNVQTHGIATIASASTTVNCYIGPASGTAWTASGNCRLFASGVTLTYEI